MLSKGHPEQPQQGLQLPKGQGLNHHTTHHLRLHHPSRSLQAPCFPFACRSRWPISPPGFGRQSYRRKYRVRGLAEDGAGPAKLKFKEAVNGEEKDTTVAHYYKDHHGLNLHPK